MENNVPAVVQDGRCEEGGVFHDDERAFIFEGHADFGEEAVGGLADDLAMGESDASHSWMWTDHRCHELTTEPCATACEVR